METPDPQTAELVPVIQADREAVERLLRSKLSKSARQYMLAGKLDHDQGVQAFAKHRLAHAKEQASGVELPPIIEWIVELARRDILRVQTDFIGRMHQAMGGFEAVLDEHGDGDLPEEARDDAGEQLAGLAGLALAQLAMVSQPSDPIAALAAPASSVGERVREALAFAIGHLNTDTFGADEIAEFHRLGTASLAASPDRAPTPADAEWPERAIRIAEALEAEVMSERNGSLWCRLCDRDTGEDGQQHARTCVLFNDEQGDDR